MILQHLKIEKVECNTFERNTKLVLQQYFKIVGPLMKLLNNT